MRYESPHEVTDQTKVHRMIAHLDAGRGLPPIVVSSDQALSGTHRLAAYAALDISDFPVVEVSDDVLADAYEELGLEPGDFIVDYDELLLVLGLEEYS